MIDAFHVNPYLMGPPCLDPDAEECIMLALSEDCIMSYCALSLPHIITCDEAFPVRGVSHDVLVHRSPFLLEIPFCNGDVCLLGGMGGKLSCKVPVGICRLCDHHDTP